MYKYMLFFIDFEANLVTFKICIHVVLHVQLYFLIKYFVSVQARGGNDCTCMFLKFFFSVIMYTSAVFSWNYCFQ